MMSNINIVYDELSLPEKAGIDNIIETNNGNKSGSLSFKLEDGKSVDECLIKNFMIDEKEQDLFKTKYNMAISGNGDEGGKNDPKNAKILSIHSSSLLSLMIFYNVDNKPITINCNGKNITFNKSFFEFKNKVISGPSNMDVVLVSEEDNVILFLESKFTEYLDVSKEYKGIKNSYKLNIYSKPIYDNIDSIGLKCKDYEKEFSLISNEPLYLHGIKQMISHYVGVSNFANKKFYYDKNNCGEITKFFNDDTELYLGTILYKFKNNDFENIFGSYEKKYKELVSLLKKYKSSNKINFLNNILIYQNLDKNRLDNFVARYYFK